MAARKRTGRNDFAQQVAAVKTTAADAGLVELLDSISRDPDAGPWGEWARKLAESDPAPPVAPREAK